MIDEQWDSIMPWLPWRGDTGNFTSNPENLRSHFLV